MNTNVLRTARRLLPWIAALALPALGGCAWLTYSEGRATQMARYDAVTPAAARGAARFVFDDFHGLSTETLEETALPWKLASAALVLARYPGEAPTQAHLRTILTGFGFVYPERIANWPLEQPAPRDVPIGLVTGDVTRRVPRVQLEVANLGCAGCHAGVLHDARGLPTRSVWLGVPNTSLDLDAYAQAVIAAILALGEDPARALDAVRTLYPNTSDAELATLKRFVWPRLMRRLPELRSGAAFALRNGGPGRSNGVDALKLRLGVKPLVPSAAATVSIPELANESLRSALLSDGLYAPRDAERFAARSADAPSDTTQLAGIVGFFTVSTMGVKPSRVPSILPHVGEVLDFLAHDFSPPPFPGAIDARKAARGAAVYAERCAKCHGDYVEKDDRPALVHYPNRFVAADKLGTDTARNDAVSAPLLDAIRHSTFRRYTDAAHEAGYVAPVLSGVWASAPYLHNGSVPTLWHLMHPSARPARFQVGGHALDYTRMGIAGVADGDDWRYAADYRPWSTPQWFDTREPGQGNRGHERPFEALDEDAKDALLEYLKRL